MSLSLSVYVIVGQCRSSHGSCLLKEVQVGCLTKFWGLVVFFFLLLVKCMLSGKLYEEKKKCLVLSSTGLAARFPRVFLDVLCKNVYAFLHIAKCNE